MESRLYAGRSERPDVEIWRADLFAAAEPRNRSRAVRASILRQDLCNTRTFALLKTLAVCSTTNRPACYLFGRVSVRSSVPPWLKSFLGRVLMPRTIADHSSILFHPTCTTTASLIANAETDLAYHRTGISR